MWIDDAIAFLGTSLGDVSIRSLVVSLFTPCGEKKLRNGIILQK